MIESPEIAAAKNAYTCPSAMTGSDVVFCGETLFDSLDPVFATDRLDCLLRGLTSILTERDLVLKAARNTLPLTEDGIYTYPTMDLYASSYHGVHTVGVIAAGVNHIEYKDDGFPDIPFGGDPNGMREHVRYYADPEKAEAWPFTTP